MKKLLISALLMSTSTLVFSEAVIVTETQTWKSVPITIDDTAKTYTITGTVPTEGDFYYTYSGYRCLKTRNDKFGMEPLIYKDANSVEIYCYKE